MVSTLIQEHDAILGFLDLLRQINGVIQGMSEYPGPTPEFQKLAHIAEHIYKENNILYPAALQVIDDGTVWQRLKGACDAIGYCCFTPET